MDHIDGKLPPLENGAVLGSVGDETEAPDDEGEGFEDGGDNVDADGVMIEDEAEGINGGGIARDFKIAMVGRVVIDPQSAPVASSTAQEGRSYWTSWFTGR
jgi:hypothetical protein